MKTLCKFIGWAIDGDSVIYKGHDLMTELSNTIEIYSKTKYIGIYPNEIPKQEFCRKKLDLTPVEIIGTNIKFAYIEFTMCFYLFFEIS